MKSSRPESAHCRSSKTSTVVPRSPMRSKKRRQAGKSASRPPAGDGSTPSSASSAGSTMARSASSVTKSSIVAVSPRASRRLVVVLGEAGPPAHHLAERPERDPVTVGRRSAAVPVDGLGDAVDVLLELPDQPALADAPRPGDRHEPHAPLPAGGVELFLQQAELVVAADERRLERIGRAAGRRAAATTRTARHAGTGAILPLSVVIADGLEDDRAARRRASWAHRRGRCPARPPPGGARRC